MDADVDRTLALARLHRLSRVADDVDEDLLQLVPVGHHGGQRRREVTPHRDVPGAQVIAHDFEDLIQRDREIDGVALRDVLAREAQEAVDDLVAAVRGLGDPLEI